MPSSRLQVAQRRQQSHSELPFQIITPTDPRERGAQLSVLLKEELMEDVSIALQDNGIVRIK